MKVVFIFLLLSMGTLYLFSKTRYGEFVKPIDKRVYPFKEFMPVALLILDRVGYKYNTRYDRFITAKLTQISEPKYCQYYLRVYWANKITLVLTGIIFLSFIGAFAQVDMGFVFFALVVISISGYFSYYDLDKRVKKRQLLIRLDFPDFMNKLALLINAGMNLQRAIEKIVQDNKKDRPLYHELQMVISDINAGKAENRAYEDFAKRCRTPEVTKFVTVVFQNVKKGTGDIVSILRVQSNECWEMRKNTSKRLGEEASTKLLFPLMIMFVAILIIVVTPAIIAMQGI